MMTIRKLQTLSEKENFPIYIGISSLDYETLLSKKMNFLSASEFRIFEQFKFDQKRKSFLQSRYLVKNMLSKYLGETDLAKIIIDHGIFSQPLVSYSTNKMPMISISHTKTHAACILSSAKCPIGIDIESITEKSKKNIISQTTPHEKKILKNQENENTFYTRIWTIKEALSKVLKTGIMTPFNIYEINDMNYTKNYTISQFSNFSQYRAISFHYEKGIFSFVLPSTIVLSNFDKIPFITDSLL